MSFSVGWPGARPLKGGARSALGSGGHREEKTVPEPGTQSGKSAKSACGYTPKPIREPRGGF